MNLVNQSAFLKALGWSLLDSLWQMGVLWVLYVCLTANGKRFQSRQRHTIALLSLAGGSLWFLITLVINFYNAAAAPEIVTLYITGDALTGTQQNLLTQLAAWFEPALPFLSVTYLIATCFLFIRFYRQYRFTQNLFTQGLQKAHPEWRVFLQQAIAHMGIKKKVHIWFSSLVDTPLTLGFLKPVILLPIAAVNHLSIKQAEAIILHELNHIRRNDYLVNLLIACVDIILFFNPFARLLTGIIRKEREHSCDDLVLQFRYNAGTYAQALLMLEQNRMAVNRALAIAATGKDKQFLLNRVKRILTNEPVTNSLNQKLIAYLLSALLIGFIGWYNPGKVIIKKIDTVIAPAITSTEIPATFATLGKEVAETGLLAAGNQALMPEKTNTKNNRKHQSNDQYRRLEKLIEWTADARLAELSTRLEEIPEQLVSFVDNYEFIDYSLPQNSKIKVPAAVMEAYPYVPSSSFSYQLIEDTTLPKKYIMTLNELKAKEAMEKALMALQEIDWKKLEKELTVAGKEINIKQLQVELKKAVKDVDWKKINEEAQAAVAGADEEISREQKQFTIQLGTYQKDRILKQEKLKQAQNQILLDRLEQHEQLKKMEEEKKKCDCPSSTIKKKKIVHI